ncbi:MAG: RNA 2',3'-cyclic phosphodiesterase [Bacteroidota bacterium]|nr:RNA 2',3'-cyclic phosphodiesterase [Bacteroidota bacterium]
MKRLFIAIKIEPDPSFTEIYHELISKLEYEHLRFVEPDKMHLTLRFLGDTEEDKIPDIDRLMKKSASMIKPFTLNINNTGVFGSSYNPRVIWFGIDHSEQLTHLHTRIEMDLTKVGFYPDRQNFVPHLTLSRVKKLKDVKLFQSIIADFREARIMKQEVTAFSLYESVLTREGPLYYTLGTYSLKK